MNLVTPIRILKALPSRDGRRHYKEVFRLKRWNISKRFYGDRGVPARLLGEIPIVLNPQDDGISKGIFMTGSFETAELTFIRETLKPGMVAADVGANIGVHTLVIAASVGSSGSVHSFEPSAAFAWLTKNIRRNRLEGSVVGNRIAVGSQSGLLKLNKCTDGSEAFTSISEPLFGSSHETFDATATSLDDYAEKKKITAFDLVKIDVEGHEPEVLKGCARLFARRAIRMLMFEVNNTCLHRAGTTAARLISLVRENDFVPYILSHRGKLEACPDSPTGDWTTVVAFQSEAVQPTLAELVVADRA